MGKNKLLGERGEKIAQQYLQSHGFKILTCNYRVGRYELDIIASYKNRTVFIEVKTRTQGNQGYRDNQLTKNQTMRLKKALLHYSLINHLDFKSISLDLITISFNPENRLAQLRHYRNIL